MIDFKEVNEISGEFVETILDKLGIDYINEGEYICVQCPFHNGDGYNLKWRGGFWYCFTQCKEKRSMIDLVGKVLHITSLEASYWLCEALNIDLGTITLDSNKIAIRSNIAHLRSMRLKRNVVEYNPVSKGIIDSIDNYHHPYILKHYRHDTLNHFNVGYSRYGDLENRVCFPINSPDGITISISGRSIDENIKPKYMVIEGTSKGETLFGIDKIEKDDNYIIVVEGFHGVLSLYEWGYKSVVAIMGSSLSNTQRSLLLGLGRKIIVIGDNDIAGERMAQQIYNKCYQFTECIKITLSEITNVEKASPCEKDLGFDGMVELDEKISELTRN